MLRVFREKLKKIAAIFSVREEYPYRLEEINLQKNVVILHCAGSRTVIKLPVEDAIADSVIINGLSPYQACLLGGCYGRLMRISPDRKKKLSIAKEVTFSLNHNTGRYAIRYEHRDGNIGYVNKKTQQSFTEHPLTIVNNDYVISDFSPSEACYIGILAGSSLERAILSGKGLKETEELMNKMPKLRLVG